MFLLFCTRYAGSNMLYVRDSNVYMYDVNSGLAIDKVQAHEDTVSGIGVFSCLSRGVLTSRIVSSSWDGNIKVTLPSSL